MAREIDFSPLARYTARQQQNEDNATRLLMGSLANAGKTFEPLLRQGFSQKMIADAGEQPWEALGKLAAYNPEMHKTFAPEAKQAHLAHISKETDYGAKLQDLEEKQKRLDALNEEKRKWHEPQTVKPFDPVADARFMYPVTADKGGILRQTGKSPIENEIAIAEAERNAALKGLQPVLKADEFVPTLDNEKVLKARQQALVNEGYLEEAKRLESNLLSDDQRFMNALGKTVDSTSARIIQLESELNAPTTTDSRKKEIEADLRTLRGFLDYINQGKKPFSIHPDAWILVGRNNSKIDFSKNPLEQTNENVPPTVPENIPQGQQPNPTPENIYRASKTLEEVENIFTNNLNAEIESKSFKDDAAKNQWVENQIEFVKNNDHLQPKDKADFEKWAKSKMKNVPTDASRNAAANAQALATAKNSTAFIAFGNYTKLASAFSLSLPTKVEDIPGALQNLKARISSGPEDPIFELISNASKTILKFDIITLFKPEKPPTAKDWNKFVDETFGLSGFEKWFGTYENLMTTTERDMYQAQIDGVKGLMMETPSNKTQKKPAATPKTQSNETPKTPSNETPKKPIQRRGQRQ